MIINETSENELELEFYLKIFEEIEKKGATFTDIFKIVCHSLNYQVREGKFKGETLANIMRFISALLNKEADNHNKKGIHHSELKLSTHNQEEREDFISILKAHQING